MRLICLIWKVLLATACHREGDLKRSHEMISVVAENEKSKHFEVVLLAEQTDTLWVSFWENSLMGDWIDRNGKTIKITEVFKSADLSHLKDQYKKPFLIDKSLLSGNIELTNPAVEFIDQIDYQYYKISTPAFTRDNMYCLIYWEDVCHMDCGGGGFFVYRKNENGKWEQYLSKYLWMS